MDDQRDATTVTVSESAEEVAVVRDAGVMIITINRPHARNAVSRGVSIRVAEALDELDGSDDLTVGILTGAGQHFCAGMDLKRFLKGERAGIPGRGFAGITEAPPAKPMIAAVEGYALAGGCEVVAACDLVVAARSAKFGIPEVKRGLVAAAGGLMRLPSKIPLPIAMELALTGDLMSAERAHQVGLVNRLSDDGYALATANEIARAIAANGPLAVRASKQIMTEYHLWPDDQRWAQQCKITDRVFASDDAQEGARAFAEKRPPRWTGR